MIRLSIKSELSNLTRGMDDLSRTQIPFATALALNRVAQFAQDALKVAMKISFDRPTPYTLNSLFIKPATKTNPVVTVGHKSSPGRLTASTYLRAEIEGGSRGLKSTEKKAGEYLVPARATKLDAYGNIPARLLGAIRQLLASNQGSMEFGNQTLVVIRAGNPRGITPGVYSRVSSKVSISGRKGSKVATQSSGALKPVVFFENQVRYRERYDMVGTVQRVVGAEFDRQFKASMEYALSTARR